MHPKPELMYIERKPEIDILSNTISAMLTKVRTLKTSFAQVDNRLIFGDNLTVLKSLINTEVKGNVRLIYIDPPFSTNNYFRIGKFRTSTISPSKDDEIAYDDKLSGSQYLEFLRERLIFLRELLADNGSIYVHIDWKMGHYVKVLMDEIFGEENFINDITRIKCNPKNFSRNGFGNVKDMILFYSKSKDIVWNESKENYTEKEVERLFKKIDKDGRKYTTIPLHAPGETKNGATGQLWKGIKPPKGRHWRSSPEELTKLDKMGLIEWSKTGNPRRKIYAVDFVEKKKKRQDIWEFKDPTYPVYPTEKNLEMLKTIVEASSNKEDLVLDCFAGSGTTLVASELLKRKWIGIDNSEIAIKIAQKRLAKINASYNLFHAT